MLRHLFSLSADKLLDIIINSTVWNLVEHPDWITFDACNDSYGKTLKPWHEGQKWFDPGNMVEAQFAWDRKEFMEMVGGDRDVMGDMKNFYFTPLLEKARKFLQRNNFVNGEMFRKTLSGRCVQRLAFFEAFQVLSVLELTLLRCPHRQ